MMWSASVIARKWTWALVSRHWYPPLTLYRFHDNDIHLEDTHLYQLSDVDRNWRTQFIYNYTLCIDSATWTFIWRIQFIYNHTLCIDSATWTFIWRIQFIYNYTLCIDSATWTFIWRAQFIYNYTLCIDSATWTLGDTQFSRKQYSQFIPGCIGSVAWILVRRRHSVRKSDLDNSLCINQWLTWTFIWTKQSFPGSNIPNSFCIGSATLHQGATIS